MTTKRLNTLWTGPVVLTRSIFFIVGVVLTVIIMKAGMGSLPTFMLGGKAIYVYSKIGWVAIPLVVSASVLLWQTIEHFRQWRKGESLSPRQIQILMKVASLSPQLGLLGTVIGVIVALTSPTEGISVVEAQAHKAHVIGTALYTTMIGVILSMGAEIQIPELEEDNNGL